MSESSSIKTSRLNETQNKQQQFELRKLKSDYHSKYNEIVKKNEEILGQAQKSYDTKIGTLENQLGIKLADIRIKHLERVKMENSRLDSELQDIKAAHQDKINEIKKGQEIDINDLEQSHNDHIENAKQKFEKELSKYRTN